jgi:hypothetical protein
LQFHSCVSPDLIGWLDPKLALARPLLHPPTPSSPDREQPPPPGRAAANDALERRLAQAQHNHLVTFHQRQTHAGSSRRWPVGDEHPGADGLVQRSVKEAPK